VTRRSALRRRRPSRSRALVWLALRPLVLPWTWIEIGCAPGERDGRAAVLAVLSGARRPRPRRGPRVGKPAASGQADSPDLGKNFPGGNDLRPQMGSRGLTSAWRRPGSSIRNTLHDCRGVAAPLRPSDECKMGCPSADQNCKICCFLSDRPGSLTETPGPGPEFTGN
jgi:hypothetical protein